MFTLLMPRVETVTQLVSSERGRSRIFQHSLPQ